MKKRSFFLWVLPCIAAIFSLMSVGRQNACVSRTSATGEARGEQARALDALAEHAVQAIGHSMLIGRVLNADGAPARAAVRLFDAALIERISERPCQPGHPSLLRCECPLATAEIAHWIEMGELDGPVPLSTAQADEDGLFELAVPAADPFWLAISLSVPAAGAGKPRAYLRAASLEEVEASVARAGEAGTGEGLLQIHLPKPVHIAGHVRDRHGLPIDGAEVAALPLFFPEAQIAAASATDGGFAFDGLSYEPHRLVATAPGYLPASALLNPAIQAEAVDFTLSAPRALAGRVIGADGRPVGRARVHIGAVGGPWQQALETGDDGRFAFENLIPGNYEVLAIRGSASAQASARLPDPDKGSMAGEGEVEIELHLIEGLSISGRVTDARSGRGLSRARVAASLLGASGSSSHSDVTGSFEISGVLPGSALTASADGFQPRTVHLAPGASTTAEVDFPLAPLLTVEGRVVQRDGLPAPGLQVILTQGSDLSAVLSDASGSFRFEVERAGAASLEVHHSALGSALLAIDVPSSGVEIRLDVGAQIIAQLVEEDSGLPISGGRMRVARGSPAARMIEAETLTSDLLSGADGAIALAGLREGLYDAIFSAPGFREVRLPDLRLAPEQRLDVGRVKLSKGASIEGIARSPSGEPMSGVRIAARQANAVRALSDLEGRFVLKGLEADAHDAGVELVAERGDAFAKKWVSLTERFVELRLNATVHRISGRLLDARSLPVPQFAVNDQLFNAPNGYFELSIQPAAQLMAAEEGFALTILVPGEPALRRIIELAPGDQTDLGDIFLEPSARIEGQVVNGEGQPIAGAVVTIGGDPRAEGMATSGADGSFAMDGIPRGSSIYLAACQGGVCAERFLAIPAQGTLFGDVTLMLPQSGAIEGVVRDGHGNPLAGAQLSLLGDPSRRTITASSGHYHLAPIEAASGGAPAAVRCQFEHPDGRIRVEVRSVEVLPQQTSRLDFEVGAATASMSAIVDDSVAARYAVLLPYGSDLGQTSQSVPFVGGIARFEHLPAGEYLLLARSKPWTRALASSRVTLRDGDDLKVHLRAGAHAPEIEESLTYFDL